MNAAEKLEETLQRLPVAIEAVESLRAELLDLQRRLVDNQEAAPLHQVAKEQALPEPPAGFIPWVKFSGQECPIDWAIAGYYALVFKDGASYSKPTRGAASEVDWWQVAFYSIPVSLPGVFMNLLVGAAVVVTYPDESSEVVLNFQGWLNNLTAYVGESTRGTLLHWDGNATMRPALLHEIPAEAGA